MRVGPGILAYSGHLPRNLDAGRAGPDSEAVIADLCGNNGLRKLADDGELVAEVAIECLEPIRQSHDCIAIRVGSDIAVVNVHHVRRLDEGVVEVPVSGVEWMVYLEGSSRFREVANYLDVARESPGEPRRRPAHAVTSESFYS